MTFIIINFFLIISLTLLADSLTGIGASEDIAANMPTGFDGGGFQIFGAFLGFIGTFFQILTFSLSGIPTLVNLLFFVPISGGMIFIITSLIRGGS